MYISFTVECISDQNEACIPHVWCKIAGFLRYSFRVYTNIGGETQVCTVKQNIVHLILSYGSIKLKIQVFSGMLAQKHTISDVQLARESQINIHCPTSELTNFKRKPRRDRKLLSFTHMCYFAC